MSTDTQVFYIEKTIEVEIKITIEKEENLYYAFVYDELGQSTKKLHCWVEDDNLYTEECDTEQEYDCVIETFRSYIKENGIKYARKCSKCNNGMNEGYFANYEYFCSDSCLHTKYTAKEWEELASNDENDSYYYWTEWETEEDFDYVLFDNKLITI